jgi:hypothetical protein
MRFVENRNAGRGMREFHNLDPPPEGPRPGHLDLGWSSVVRQVGTRRTGRIEYVTVHYVPRGKRTFTGREADRVLRTVQEHRADVKVRY